MAYRLAKSLQTLRDDVNAAAPVRNRQSDGWIGDAAHASRTSDHNPWVKDGKTGIVTAIDITNDPEHGVDGNLLAEALKEDWRVKYVIWNRRIWSAKTKAWKKYTGKNPHDHHVHVSVLSDKPHYDSPKHWDVGRPPIEPPEAPDDLPVAERPKQKLKLGDQGGDVFELQRRLGVEDDGDFGPKTQRAVTAFQRANKLVADGIVGPYTWDKLEEKKSLPANPVGLLSFPDTAEHGSAGQIVETEPGTAQNGYGTPRWAIDYLKSLGWSDVAAIAMIANLMWESGGNRTKSINWDAHGDKGRDGNFHSHGAGQWNDRHGRYQNLQQFAEQHGARWDDARIQLDFMDDELKSSERFTGNKLREAQTLDDATEAALGYWRPSVPHQDKRVAIAEKLEEKYHAAS